MEYNDMRDQSRSEPGHDLLYAGLANKYRQRRIANGNDTCDVLPVTRSFLYLSREFLYHKFSVFHLMFQSWDREAVEDTIKPGWIYYSSGCKCIKLFYTWRDQINDKNQTSMLTTYSPPNLVGNILGFFKPFPLYAAEHGTKQSEIIQDSRHNIICQKTYYENGALRQEWSPIRGVIFCRDEKGRECILPESGSFFLVKGCFARLEHISPDSPACPMTKLREAAKKSCLPEPKIAVYVKMEVDADAKRVTPLMSLGLPLKGRVQRGKVVAIWSKNFPDVSFSRAESCVVCSENKLDYVVGEVVTANSYSGDPLQECGPGIHGVMYPDLCDFYFSDLWT